MKKKTIFGIIAAALIFAGFGLITEGKTIQMNNLGSLLLGLGCLYLIISLFVSMRNSKK